MIGVAETILYAFHDDIPDDDQGQGPYLHVIRYCSISRSSMYQNLLSQGGEGIKGVAIHMVPNYVHNWVTEAPDGIQKLDKLEY